MGRQAHIAMPVRPHLHFDFETFCELDLKKVGVGRYARHPSCEVLMCAWAWGDRDEVKQWAPVEIGEDMPAELEDGLHDERVMKFAWNASFERNICEHVLGILIPYDQWRDPMVLAFSLSFPGKLEKAGPVVGLPEDKVKDRGSTLLINKFCKPRRLTKNKQWDRNDWTTDPEDWKRFLSYNRQDVVAEKAFWKRCWIYDLPQHEWDLWCLDQEINEAGIPINMGMVDNAVDLYVAAVTKRLDRMKEISGLNNPNSAVQLLPWLRAHKYEFEDLKKGHIKRSRDRMKEQNGDPDCIEMLGLRAEVSKTSVKKYRALQEVVSDGVFRHAFQFAGAGRTWRWAGRKVQYHNAPRPPPYLEKHQEEVARALEFMDSEEFELVYEKPMDALATGVRPAVQAPEGYLFVAADLNAIENRVLGYMAQDPKILRVFENNLDPYIDFSTYMLGGTYDERFAEFKAGNKGPRTLSKPAVLGCGYQLGAGTVRENDRTGEFEATGLLGYAWGMGVTEFTLEQSILAVQTWRETFVECTEFWKNIEKAAKRCVRTGRETECWPVRFDRKGPFMRMLLPSGRALHYCRPRIEDREMPWGEMRPVITYEGLTERHAWWREHTSPGKLTENADQAISRDLLAHGIILAKKEGLDVRMHVHDEIVALIPERQANWGMATLLDCMKEKPEWAPTIPLGAAGSINRYYVKD